MKICIEMSELKCPPEVADAWRRIQDVSELDWVPDELRDVGGFEFFVAPVGVLPRYGFGGFTEIKSDENGQRTAEVTMLVSPDLPAHVRGFIVAHLLRHKLPEDVHDPHMCVNHDRWLQHEILDREPSLLLPFYEETSGMYRDGLKHKPRSRSVLEQVERNRYQKGFDNAQTRGGLIVVAAETKLQLADSGIEGPDGEYALYGVSQEDGKRWFIKLGIERGKKGHTCKDCSQHVSRGSERITTVIENRWDANKYTHHHYHPGCFSYVELGRFDVMQQVPVEEVPTH